MKAIVIGNAKSYDRDNEPDFSKFDLVVRINYVTERRTDLLIITAHILQAERKHLLDRVTCPIIHYRTPIDSKVYRGYPTFPVPLIDICACISNTEHRAASTGFITCLWLLLQGCKVFRIGFDGYISGSHTGTMSPKIHNWERESEWLTAYTTLLDQQGKVVPTTANKCVHAALNTKYGLHHIFGKARQEQYALSSRGTQV